MKKTLWLLVLQGQVADLLFTFYASDEAEAEEIASDLENDKGAKRRDLRQFKNGFRFVQVELPGTIEVPDD